MVNTHSMSHRGYFCRALHLPYFDTKIVQTKMGCKSTAHNRINNIYYFDLYGPWMDFTRYSKSLSSSIYT